ncbi:hypothetical protein [Polaromonas sp.]|uniref:hypothetical protein n=1 Tax=Polaromonas sp. TaxID=1869339 RepID=UPI00326772FB
MPALTVQGLVGWSRMAEFWKEIFQVNAGFKLAASSLRTVVDALAQGGPGLEASLQEALDNLPVIKARKYKTALQMLLDDYPTVCYIGIETFTTSSTQKPQPASTQAAPVPINRRIHYTSAEFKARARVYCIVGHAAPAPFELGFIQHCTSKSDVAQYTNGARMRDHCTAAMPVGDSAGPQHAPFYFQGISHGCVAAAYLQLVAGESTLDLEVGDYFNNNFHFFHPKPALANNVNAASSLTSIHRDQAFTLWLTRRKGNAERHLKQVTYRILVDVTVGNAVRTTSSARDIVVTVPAFNAVRPAVTSPTMNNLSQWQYCAPAAVNWINV